MSLLLGDTRPIVVNLGMGKDSGAWTLDALDDLNIRPRIAAVMIAQTGHEWPDTKKFMEEVVFPRLRKYNILTIQVARAGKFKRAGPVVLDRTTQPEVCFTRPTPKNPYYTLGEEMASGGTFPAVSGGRPCSNKSKGVPLDQVRKDLMGTTPYLHMIGFEVDEIGRAEKDAEHNNDVRTGWYPLIERGLDRGACGEIIESKCGQAGSKSACTFCPFALTNREGRNRTIERFKQMPKQAGAPLVLEDCGVRLNPAMGGLAGGKRLSDILINAGAEDIVEPIRARVDAAKWAVYEVRRVIQRGKPKPNYPKIDESWDDFYRRAERTKGNAQRSLHVLETGTRAEMERFVRDQAKRGAGVLKDDDGIERCWTIRRDDEGVYPMRERYMVAVPYLAHAKEPKNFDEAWYRTA